MQLDPNQQYALTIDGMSLVYALGEHLDTLRDICLKCVAVLCCRMSPLQKAKVSPKLYCIYYHRLFAENKRLV